MPMIEIASTTAAMMRTGMNSISARKPTNQDFTGSAATRSAICSTGGFATNSTSVVSRISSMMRTSVPVSRATG